MNQTAVAAAGLRKRSRRFEETRGDLPAGKAGSLADAVEIVKRSATAKFDETVELHVRLGINPTQSDQNVRGTVTLPRGTGKSRRVLVFAQGDKAKEAEDAGADHVGGKDLVEKVQGGFLDFEVAVATPDMMKDVGRLGRLLGPRGLMPNPKTGTVTFDISKAVADFKGGKIEYRNDKGANVHVPIGKASFPAEHLVENAEAVIVTLLRVKPAASKGTYIKGVTMTSTMGPGISVDPLAVRKTSVR